MGKLTAGKIWHSGRVLFAGALVFLACAPAVPASTRFMVTGDSRSSDPFTAVNAEILDEIVQAALDESVEFILFTGDLVWGYGTAAASLENQLLVWRDVMQPAYDAGIGIYPCRGNHDAAGDTPERNAWNHVFSGAYALPDNGPPGEENITYSFSHGNIFVVSLDQYVNDNRLNQNWLDEQFDQNSLPHVFVFGHVPAFKSQHPDCLDDYPLKRNLFWGSIAREGGRTYFAGHDHFYAHARIDNGDGRAEDDLHQFIVGSAGAPLYIEAVCYDGLNVPFDPQPVYSEFEYGYVLAEVDGPTVTLTWKHRTASGVYEASGDVFSYEIDFFQGFRLSAFEALPQSEQVLIRWTTQYELALAGFNLYRSGRSGKKRERINTELIPAEGSELVGASYEFRDADVRKRRTYWYWLEAVSPDGETAVHGPVRAVPLGILGSLPGD